MMESCSNFNWLHDNIDRVREKMEKAAQKANRSCDDITLLAVTKTVPQEIIGEAIRYGLTEIGENKVQEMLEKDTYLADFSHKTHIIGHLQTNKVKYLPQKVQMIQSVDSIKLADKIEQVFAASSSAVDVLVEVNIGEEQGKTGILPQQAIELCRYVETLPHIKLRGLMAIPPICQGDLVRNYFAKMYQLFVDIREKKSDNKDIDILSMGMSGDFESAILEGSTMVRVGTSLFGKRDYTK